MLNTVILSKDRPAQLDLLLRSIKRFVVEWADNRPTVMYLETDATFHRAYQLVEAEHPEFIYVRQETTFRWALQGIALGRTEKYFQLLMDDDVFIRPFSLGDPEFVQYAGDPQIVALNLRLSPTMDYCYSQNVIVDPPEFAEDGTWDWRGRYDDWGYPHSVDGSIWTLARVQGVLARGKYESVGALEPALMAAMTAPRVLCYDKPRLIGIPDNSVQTAFKANRHEGGDPAEMNERYMAGERIALEPLAGMDPPSAHVGIQYEWETR